YCILMRFSHLPSLSALAKSSAACAADMLIKSAAAILILLICDPCLFYAKRIISSARLCSYNVNVALFGRFYCFGKPYPLAFKIATAFGEDIKRKNFLAAI